MELRILRYFLTVARERNITRAAEVLHITQPTLSRQLMQLEEELGKPLFLRGKGHITLTDEGMLLRRRAEELLELADKTIHEFQEQEDLIQGEIFIGSAEMRCFQDIAKVMKIFTQDYPLITYHLFDGSADDIKEKISNGLLDLALLNEPVDLENYEFIRLPKKERWGILLLKTDPLAQKQTISPRDVHGARIIASRRSLIHRELENWFGPSFEHVKEIATMNLIHNATMMVEEGLGYALTLEGLIPDSASSTICFRPLSPTLETGCVLVWKKYQVFSPATKEFLAYLKHAFQA